MQYSDDTNEEAENFPILGSEYIEARKLAEGFLSKWKEDDAEILAKEIVKPVLDVIMDRVWDAFRDHILSDTEDNVASHMRDMVEKSVNALIGGRKWANIKYIQSPFGDGIEVRKTLAMLYSDEIKDGRIADLEREVSELRKRLEWEQR